MPPSLPCRAPPCSAIVFDFDGVLVDSNGIKLAAFIELYGNHGNEVHEAIATHYRLHGGLSRDRKFRHYEHVLLGRPADEERIASLSQRFSEMVEDAVTRCPPIPGGIAFVRRHSGRLPMFIASGTPEVELRRIVHRRGWASLFADVRGAPTHKTDLLGEILERHGLDPATTVMVGDALTDLEAAQANGMPFIGVVPQGADDIFPAGTRIEPDLTALDAAISVVVNEHPATKRPPL